MATNANFLLLVERSASKFLRMVLYSSVHFVPCRLLKKIHAFPENTINDGNFLRLSTLSLMCSIKCLFIPIALYYCQRQREQNNNNNNPIELNETFRKKNVKLKRNKTKKTQHTLHKENVDMFSSLSWHIIAYS